jgi:hypothetical protein
MDRPQLITGFRQNWVEYADYLEVTLKNAHKDIIAVEKERNALAAENAELHTELNEQSVVIAELTE